MGTIAEYGSLEQAVRALNNYADELETPTEQFLTEVKNRIGATGEGDAWSGTAASEVVPTLEKLYTDLKQLKSATLTFASNVGIALSSYEVQDQEAQASINSIVG